MLPGIVQLLMLALLAAAVVLFVGTIAYHRIRQEIVHARWMREPKSGQRREAFRRRAVKARRIEPLLHVYIAVAAVMAASLLLYQLVVAVLAAV
jgi:hypothetical protein